MSPEASAALLSAAQSDKLRVSVRTDHLREVLAAEQKAAADLEWAVGEGTTRETMIREQGAHLCLLRDERDDLQGANERQAFRIAELKDLCRRSQQDVARAQAEAEASTAALAQTTAPPLAASLVELVGVMLLSSLGGWLLRG